MFKLFNKKKKYKTDIGLGPGRIIKIHNVIRDATIPNPNAFRLDESKISGIPYTCLQSYDNASIFVPKKIFDKVEYVIFGEYVALDTSDNKYIINISQFAEKYKVYSNTVCMASDTVVPTFINIYKIYTCEKDRITICISAMDRLSKADELYSELSELRQIKARLHI